MGIYIKGMEMPTTGFYILSIDNTGKDKTIFTIAEHTNSGKIIPRHIGEAVSLPPHGDLIDIDEYRDEFMHGVYALCSDDSDNYRANAIIDLFDEAPTIIEAEGKK